MTSADTVRFGLIGCGAWGFQHARAIAKTPGAQLVAIAEPAEQNRATAKEAHPQVQFYDDYRAMLAKERLDAVDIVLPPHLHYEGTQAALKAGCHVLLEKPMCLKLAECDKLIALSREKKLHLAIGHEFRFSSLWGGIKQMVDDGAIGDPRYCLIELWRNPYRQGTGGWRYNIRQVGNWILEEPIHFFDLARWYFGKAGQPVSVVASASHKRDDHPELQDNFSAMVRFPNGGYAVISQTLAGYEHHQMAKLTGTNGALWATWSGAMDRTFHPTFSLKHFDGEKTQEVPITRITGEVYELEDELADLTAAVRSAPLHCATGEDGRWAVAMCLKAQESVTKGRVVKLGLGRETTDGHR
ncbi:MAG TPA: Gfo/Idh/MocA family oxidoreductase [Candidatus Acidoferrum sp.]|nr:Gfo/Idh/MocA family oxidoreductase [Candidatus Acidoferrum sp.]